MRKVMWMAVAGLVLAGATNGRAQAPADAQPPKAVSEKAPGLYLTFQTDLGNISCKIYETEAPVTTRRIIGLALGRIAYVDPITKQVARKRLYDGLLFHRVIPGFMIQGGDPTGTGMSGPGGPGFPFKDEFVSALKFDVPGRLAMANSGPNTNGSQFFITEVPTPHLNGKHTILGQCENPGVITAIVHVPRNADDKPVKPVHIQKVLVQRVGPAPANPPEGLPLRRATAVPPKKKAK
jgi:peptidyl-prolyl cis-trans isomerase A (cyclophilin A)